MAILTAQATGFVNEVTKTSKGTFRYKMSIITSSYKDENDEWQDNYMFVTMFSKEDLIAGLDYQKKPMLVEFQGLNFSVNEYKGKTYVNHTAFVTSLQPKLQPQQVQPQQVQPQQVQPQQVQPQQAQPQQAQPQVQDASIPF